MLKACLEIFSYDNIVREGSPHRHIFHFIDHDRVGFNFDVVLEPLLVLEQLLQRVVGLLELVLEVLDAVVEVVDLLQQLVVRVVQKFIS